MRTATLTALILIAASADLVVGQTPVGYRARLSKIEALPPVESRGTGFVYGWFQNFSKTCPTGPDDPFELRVEFSSLSSEPTALRLFRGQPGSSAELYYTVVEGVIDQSYPIVFTVPVDDCHIWQGEELWTLLETERYPNGELWGQLLERNPVPTLPASWGSIKREHYLR